MLSDFVVHFRSIDAWRCCCCKVYVQTKETKPVDFQLNLANFDGCVLARKSWGSAMVFRRNQQCYNGWQNIHQIKEDMLLILQESNTKQSKYTTEINFGVGEDWFFSISHARRTINSQLHCLCENTISYIGRERECGPTMETSFWQTTLVWMKKDK
jgi:hypothetical protein